MGELTNDDLANLAKHKYKRDGDYTLLEPYLQPFWNWTVELCPLWWAPNAITFIGLLINVLTSLLILWYNPNGKDNAPSWVLILAGLGVFIYQTLDSIDGKQARRTGSASPLGELFDHGCDAISAVVLSIVSNIHHRYPPEFYVFLILGGLSSFYIAHWTSYCTGALSFGKVDVVEMQLLMIGGFFISGIFGEDVWLNKVPGTEIPINAIVGTIVVLTGILFFMKSMHTIFVKGGIGENGGTVANTSVVLPIIPLLYFNLITVGTAYSCQEVFYEHPALFMCVVGLIAAKISTKIIVAGMCKAKFDLWDNMFIWPILMLANHYQTWFIGLTDHEMLQLLLVICSVNLVIYNYRVSTEICDYLNIYCFSIKKPPTNKKE